MRRGSCCPRLGARTKTRRTWGTRARRKNKDAPNLGHPGQAQEQRRAEPGAPGWVDATRKGTRFKRTKAAVGWEDDKGAHLPDEPSAGPPDRWLEDRIESTVHGADSSILRDGSGLRLDRKGQFLRLQFVNVFVRDQERSLRFFVDQL